MLKCENITVGCILVRHTDEGYKITVIKTNGKEYTALKNTKIEDREVAKGIALEILRGSI